MKKILPGCLLLLTVLALLCTAALGEEDDDRIHITNAEGLIRMAQHPSGSYVLDNDIDLSGWVWKPLRFSGTLDGNGHSIDHLRIASFDPEKDTTIDGNGLLYDTDLMAFFSVADHATIRNVRFTDVDIRGESDEHAFAAVVAAVSTQSVFENVSISGSVCLYCGGKMSGVGGFAGFGSGSITDCQADVTLIYVGTDKSVKAEQFMGAGVAAGFMDCRNVTVKIDGYASVHGYAHCGGLIGMFRQHDTAHKNASASVSYCTVSGRITFFEHNNDRRAYCKAIIGEKLTKYVKTDHNDERGFTRKEIKTYNKILLPEGWE